MVRAAASSRPLPHGGLFADPDRAEMAPESRMPDPAWKAALRERHALAWILFMLLILAIGFAVVYLGP